MRSAYAHDALLVLTEGADERAPGAAVTVALCGSTPHEGPCPLAPHHTATRHSPEGLLVRVLFATEPAREVDARTLIADALAAGHVAGHVDMPSTRGDGWRLVAHRRSEPSDAEREHAARLVASP
jgi:hypothetical protein